MTLEATQPRSLLRRLYDWCIEAAHKPHAMWSLGAIAFAESSFFPVPPDVMLIPMALARPERAYVMAAWCTVASVVGGILGYAIGALLYDSVGAWLIHLYGYADKVDTFRAAYAQWGAWIILLKGLTPIPYKIVTITSGFAGLQFRAVHFGFDHCPRRPLLSAGIPAAPLRRTGPPLHRKAARSLGFAGRRRGRHRHRDCGILDLTESGFPGFAR